MPETQTVDIIERAIRRQLGQLRPANTTAASIYSPGNNISAIIDSIFVSNNTAGAIAFRIFHDDDGTTYDQSTALYYDVSLAANATQEIDLLIYMNNPNGNLAVRSATGDALAFTVYGRELT